MQNKTLKIATVVVFAGLLLTFVVFQSGMYNSEEETTAPNSKSLRYDDLPPSDSITLDSLYFEPREDQISPQTYSSDIDDEKDKLEEQKQNRIRAYSSKSIQISTPINPKAITPLNKKQ